MSHTDITFGPLSLLEHDTANLASYGTSSIRPFGHSCIHLPHATHFSLSTTAMPCSIWIASNWQADTHEPNPRQPNAHALSPRPGIAAALLQSDMP